MSNKFWNPTNTKRSEIIALIGISLPASLSLTFLTNSEKRYQKRKEKCSRNVFFFGGGCNFPNIKNLNLQNERK